MTGKYNPEGSLIRLSENRTNQSSEQALARALEKQLILESIPTLCDKSFTLHFNLGSIHGVMPREEVVFNQGEEREKDIAILTRVGKPVCFKVIGFESDMYGRTQAVLSRRAAQEECVHNHISTLIPGDIIEATVTHIESFGAFLDIGCGITSLMSIDSISVSRISHPSERFSVGDKIHAVVKSIDEHGRICASMRELLGTWEENVSLFTPGQTVAGIVRSIESYGIFIELAPNLAGLSELRDGVKVGQSAAVYIKSILPDRMKIKLVIIDTYSRAEEKIVLRYFTDVHNTEHIHYWRYSPLGASKLIESRF